MTTGSSHGNNPSVTQRLARDLIGRRAGERLPRVHDYAARFRAGNGTIQAAMRFLQQHGAVRLESRGHLGTFLRDVDYTRLWDFTGLGHLACAMPMPYSARFEGLAAGLQACFRAARIPVALSFMRGARTRVQAVAGGRCDLAVVSRLGAHHAVTSGAPVAVGPGLGQGSFLSGVLLLWAGQPAAPPYPAGLRVGYDPDYPELQMIVDAEFSGLAIQRVAVTYNQLHRWLRAGDVDVVPCNADEMRPEWRFASTELSAPAARAMLPAVREAVVLAHAERPELVRLLEGILDIGLIVRLQGDHMAGSLLPSL